MADDAPASCGWLAADWPAPTGVVAGCTTRQGGVSLGCYASLNLALHVGDDAVAVQRNRRRLQAQLGFNASPAWLNQVHGVGVAKLPERQAPIPHEADAAFTRQRDTVCAVLTADCLPVLLVDRGGREIAAVHAGWRGLAQGVIEAALQAFSVAPNEVLAWLGPAIGAQVYEVGEEVYRAYVDADPGFGRAFTATRPGHWLLDLYDLARQRLNMCGVQAVYGGGFCTYTDADRFYSYRRDGSTGRMASLIWLKG